MEVLHHASSAVGGESVDVASAPVVAGETDGEVAAGAVASEALFPESVDVKVAQVL